MTKVINFLFVIFSEIEHYFYVRFNRFILSDNKKRILDSLISDGYIKIGNFISDEKIKTFRKIILNNYKEKIKHLDNDVYLGGLRFTDIKKINFLMKSFFNDPFILSVVKSFQVSNHSLKTMYQISQFKKINILKTNNNTITGLGRRWHVDSWKHGLKVMLLLSDVETKNGPMIVIKKSNKLFCKSMKFYNKISSFLRCFPNFNSNHLQYNSSDIYNKENIVELKGKAGDLFIIDTRMVHRAGVMKDGNRQVLWNYFS